MTDLIRGRQGMGEPQRNMPDHGVTRGGPPAPEPCHYWLDLPMLSTEGDSDDVDWIDWPTASCRLREGHAGKHQVVLDTNGE